MHWESSLAPLLGSVFLHVGFILGICVVALSRQRLAFSLLLFCSQKIGFLLTGHTSKNPSVPSHRSSGVIATSELIMVPRAKKCTVSPCPGLSQILRCIGIS